LPPVDAIPSKDRGDVVKELVKVFRQIRHGARLTRAYAKTTY
jgi:hypothetical protein